MKAPSPLISRSAAAFIAGLLFTPAGLHAGEGSSAERLKEGKEAFFRECSKCHTVKWPLAESYSRDDWTLTVNMMISNGAQLSGGQKELIIDYLSAKSAFETKCGACHSLERPLSKTKTLEEWKGTVSRMAGKRRGHLTAEEIEVIAAFLALGYPTVDD